MKWLLPKLILTNIASTNIFGSQEVIYHTAVTHHIQSIHYMPDMYERLVDMPSSPHGMRHVFSRFHYQHLYKRFSSVLPSYPEFCTLEENIAGILRSYLRDTRDISHMFVFEDEDWLWTDSIFSYFSQEERNQMERVLIQDLDVEPNVSVLPSVETYSFLLDKHRHPFL